MSLQFLTRSNWVGFGALVLAAILVLRGHPVEGTAMTTGAFALLRADSGAQ